jgi:PAS domain S-box-containing protein
MAREYHVLIVEDEDEQAEMVREFLRLSGPFSAEWSPTLQGMWHCLAARKPDIILLDYKLQDGTGLQALEALQQRDEKLPIIMITGQGDERLAVQAMQLGASDYLIKGSEDLLRLPSLIQKTVRAHELQQSIERSVEQIHYQAMLLNNVRDAVVVWNTEGKITFWNLAAEGLYGHSAKERLGTPVAKNYMNFFSPPVKEPPREGTSGMEIERHLNGRSGKELWVSSRVSTLRDYAANGRLIGYMDVTRDVSSRKQMEAQISAAQTRLTQSARLAAIGELASGVAHHINNPLTTIIAEAQLLLQSLPGDHVGRESAEAVEKAGWRVQKTVQQLIDFSRPPSNTMDDLSINKTIQNALALIDDNIRSHGIQLQVELADNLPSIRGNAQQLGDLWVNLLLLAHDATLDGKDHTIGVRSRQHSSGFILVEVSDDGAPIPAEEMAMLFEPNLIRPNGGRGNGIELSICQGIVQYHRGQIAAQSDPVRGTTFSVYFPMEA